MSAATSVWWFRIVRLERRGNFESTVSDNEHIDAKVVIAAMEWAREFARATVSDNEHIDAKVVIAAMSLLTFSRITEVP